MDKENLININLRINGVTVPLRVPPHLERMYRDAEEMLTERAIEVKKEHQTNQPSTELLGYFLAVEALIDAFTLQKENEAFQQKVDTYLEMLGQSAA